MTARPQRLRFRAHAPTARASALVFGDDGPLRSLPPAVATGGAAASGWAWCGPEPACGQSAEAEGWRVLVSDRLRGPDVGRWTGLGLAEVAAADPEGLSRWLSDPDARPHGGETLTELVSRVGDLLRQPEPNTDEQPGLWVVTPLVVRALVVAALDAPAVVIFSVDVGFGGEVQLSGSGRTWRLQSLSRG
ncbi:histidine phosphatase family protein [uncultured Friedmanniella sp.]|uniref:histidine phosphatase family protein n=1 Tax=uncultured Friedmanniella sp. TaxID=335381 RepID=UPI0035CAAB34